MSSFQGVKNTLGQVSQLGRCPLGGVPLYIVFANSFSGGIGRNLEFHLGPILFSSLGDTSNLIHIQSLH